MGLIKAFGGALGGTLADQWKEYFYCDSLADNVLVAKGQKRTSRRSSNTKGEDNIISAGSGIAVNEGQCMVIVCQGEVVEFCAEPGEFTYEKTAEPSLFAGNLGKSILGTFATIGRRFTYGGDTGKDQRVSTSTSRRFREINTARQALFRSAWWIAISVWMLTSPSAATANFPTRSLTPCSSIRTFRAT